ncbi:PRKR-interacting protein 1 homolog [Belonocnema kinseyi]|uniref:PRKR-interacting protein 1 homolog n=1 Tax=Belonocnema kinseyi TaxID=2817044 RepID=UPI00143DAC7D|nr:PRKR-interacting protein 1 homolog [Belonocnema kinseyi]
MSDHLDNKEDEKPVVAKTAVDLQRLKLMKLMKNPEKPVLLPEKTKLRNTPTVPEFVRNVMGSSAGAGSGEFHVYRHLRRKEYSRQKFIQEKGQKELLDEEYHKKLDENKRKAEEATKKRRAKRLKKRQKIKPSEKVQSYISDSEHQEGEQNYKKVDEYSCSESEEENIERVKKIIGKHEEILREVNDVASTNKEGCISGIDVDRKIENETELRSSGPNH